MAIGRLVVPVDILFQKSATDGNIQPENTPVNIARNIQSVRNRSKNLSLVFIEYMVNRSATKSRTPNNYSNSFIIQTAVEGQIETNSVELLILSGTAVRSIFVQFIFGKNPDAVVVSK